MEWKDLEAPSELKGLEPPEWKGLDAPSGWKGLVAETKFFRGFDFASPDFVSPDFAGPGLGSSWS